MFTLFIACLSALSIQTPQTARFACLSNEGISIVERGETRALAKSGGAESFGWDRDGEHLLITRGARLERLSIATGALELVTDQWPSIRMPDVSPDGTMLVFAATSEPPPSQAWKIVLFERSSRTSKILCDGYDPCFSRDGARVFCERYPDRDVWSVELASGALARAFDPPADRYTAQTDPFSARIAYSSQRRLVVRDLEGAGERVLSPEGVYDRFASFAPDRRHMLFFRESSSGPEGSFRGIREVDLSTDVERTLVQGNVDLAFYAPPTIAEFVEISRSARAALDPAARVPVDLGRDPALHRWLTNQCAETGDRHLILPDVTELAACEAFALSQFDGSAIFLPKLERLDAATATLLARFNGSLFLDGLQRIEAATAGALAQWMGNGEQLFLSLDGLRDPSIEVLTALRTCRGWGLSLDGLALLNPDGAKALGPVHVAYLDLDGLTSIDFATAEVMSQWGAKFLSLRGLQAPEPRSVELLRRGCAELILR